MNAFKIYPLIAFFVLSSIGCATSHKYVLVSVVDFKTGRPVAGAIVSVHFYPGTRSTTDKRGLAMLKLRPSEAQAAIFDVKVVNRQYNQDFGYSETPEGEWINRPEGLIPIKPDIVLEVVSRFDEEKSELEKQAAKSAAEEAAKRLFRESPEYWPERTNEMAEILFSLRWDHASRNTLGSQGDIDSIRSVIIRHIDEPKATVDEIRWVSPSVVMVRSSWNSGPEAAGGYTYALRKGNAGWVVVTYAMDWVS